MQSTFYHSELDQPHPERTRAIIKAHPEIRSLFGRNPWSALITLGVVVLVRIKRRIFDNPRIERMPIERGDKRLALFSSAIWLAAIAAGRLLAYTYRWEMLGIPAIT